MLLESKTFKLSRQKTLSFLSGLEAGAGKAVTTYLPFGLPLTEIENLLGSLPDLSESPVELPRLIASAGTGSVLFWGASHKCLIMPPFPISDKFTSSGYDTGPLRSLLDKDYTIALVLVRLGSFAIGVCRGEKLVASKVGTGLIHSRHRQGGSSSARFARRREKQIEGFMGRICEHAREKIEPYTRMMDYIVYGGARTTILELQKECPFLGQFYNRSLPPLLTIPEPRQYVLEEAVRQVWTSSVVKWVEEESPSLEQPFNGVRFSESS